jgi:hypothetical protein
MKIQNMKGNIVCIIRDRIFGLIIRGKFMIKGAILRRGMKNINLRIIRDLNSISNQFSMIPPLLPSSTNKSTSQINGKNQSITLTKKT